MLSRILLLLSPSLGKVKLSNFTMKISKKPYFEDITLLGPLEVCKNLHKLSPGFKRGGPLASSLYLFHPSGDRVGFNLYLNSETIT